LPDNNIVSTALASHGWNAGGEHSGDEATVFGKLGAGTSIRIGDRFVKSDDPSIVWVVDGEGSDVTPIPHFQVVQENRQTRRRTLSEATLLNTDFYRRVE